MIQNLLNKLSYRIYCEFHKRNKVLLVYSRLKYAGKGISIGNYTSVLNPEKLKIGNNTQIADYTVILALNGITIGENCRISSSVMISSVSHKINSYDRILDDLIDGSRLSIEIGNNVWIGASCVILPGTVIGDNSIIGAGTVVKGIINANEIWTGLAGRKIKEITY